MLNRKRTIIYMKRFLNKVSNRFLFFISVFVFLFFKLKKKIISGSSFV